jgi:plasmid maintenance system antidote protein VapI
MKKRKWTKDEIWYLRVNWHKKLTREIAEHLGRSENSINCRAWRLKLSRKARSHWSPYDDILLKRKYEEENLSVEEVCELMGRSKGGLHARRIRLGIPSKKPNNRWSLKDEDFLRKEWGYLPDQEIADRLGRTLIAVRRRAAILRISERHAHISMNKAAKIIGYDKRTVKALVKKAQLPHSKSLTGMFRLPEKTVLQLQKIVEALGYPCRPIQSLQTTFVCRECIRKTRPHHANGLCHPCYIVDYRRKRRAS